MIAKHVIVILLLSTALVSPQGGPPGGGGGGGGAQATALQAFADTLKLDEKTQIPKVEAIFTEAARAAQPVSQQVVQLRRKLYDAEAAGKADEISAAREALAAASAKMTSIETDAFKRVFDILKPGQQKKAAEAYALMTGLFQPAPRTNRGPGRGGAE